LNGGILKDYLVPIPGGPTNAEVAQELGPFWDQTVQKRTTSGKWPGSAKPGFSSESNQRQRQSRRQDAYAMQALTHLSCRPFSEEKMTVFHGCGKAWCSWLCHQKYFRRIFQRVFAGSATQ
jgi:hypothetical protein